MSELDFNIEEYELEVWKKELEKANREMHEAHREYKNDPLTDLLNCQMEFKELLDNNKGAHARTTPEFMAKVSELAKREKRAKRLHDKGIDILKLGDVYYNKKWKADQIAQHYAMIEFRLGLKKRK